MEPDRDTIFALSSGRLPSAIAIVRLSGPNAGPALRLLANKRPLPRRAVRVSLRAADQNTIDEAIDVARQCPGVIAPGASLEVREFATL